MTKRPYDAPIVAEPIIELPPVDAADAEARAARERNAGAFFAGFSLPAGTDPDALCSLLERYSELVHEGDLFMLDMARTGAVDRARFRDLLEGVGQTRRELLTALGADPESEDLLPFTAALHES